MMNKKEKVQYSIYDKEKKYPKDSKYHPKDPRNRPVDEGLQDYLEKHYKEKVDDGLLKCCQDYYRKQSKKVNKKDEEKQSNIKRTKNN